MKYLLTSVSAIALIVGSAVADPFYVGGYGGLNLGSDFSDNGVNPDLSFTSTPEAGYVAGGFVGAPLAILPGVSVEFEASWRNNKTTGERTLKGNMSGLVGNDSTYGVTANLRYTYEVDGFKPYVLGGAGYGSRRITFEPAPNNFFTNGMGADRSGFVWTAGAGIDFAATETMDIGFGYRFFAAPSIGRIIEWDCEQAFFDARGDNHAFIASATWHVGK
jgi:opacity protein-like surface antigen